MATDMIDIGKVSSRGQIAIPTDMRNRLNLQEGARVLFILTDSTLLIKKVTSETFSQITEPLRQKRKKINEGDVNRLVHHLRKD
ncbi:AbrB/MazE/SpoVT family DNA-binding domain-containing protein [Candidatus Woesearchaeota archaeon]|nr:AbrB/MazE/SpoVT family DNA-binding domain-containing protein [Candidatus Woesearchaeota archaeon]